MNNIVNIFEKYINPRKLLLKNYTSYGDISIYQNETLLKYYLPILDNINNLCPLFKEYIYTANQEQKDRLSYQTNIIKIINLTKEIQRIRGLKDTENIFNFDEDFYKYFTEKFQQQLKHDVNNKISILNSYIKQIEIEKENSDVVKEFLDNNLQAESSIPNPTDEELNLKYLRDSFFYNYITLKIKNLIHEDLSGDNVISNSNNSKIIKELNSKIMFIYTEVINIYVKYFDADTSIINKNKSINLEDAVLPPSFYDEPPKNYSQSIEETINEYKTMLFNIF